MYEFPASKISMVLFDIVPTVCLRTPAVGVVDDHAERQLSNPPLSMKV
jgi:hypothetical protein